MGLSVLTKVSSSMSLDDSSLPVNFHGNLVCAYNDEELLTLLQRARISKNPAIVTYGAPWWHACRQMLPTFCNLSNDYKSAMFVYADVDMCYETTRDVRYTPAFRFSRDGEKVDEFYVQVLKDYEIQSVAACSGVSVESSFQTCALRMEAI